MLYIQYVFAHSFVSHFLHIAIYWEITFLDLSWSTFVHNNERFWNITYCIINCGAKGSNQNRQKCFCILLSFHTKLNFHSSKYCCFFPIVIDMYQECNHEFTIFTYTQVQNVNLGISKIDVEYFCLYFYFCLLLYKKCTCYILALIIPKMKRMNLLFGVEHLNKKTLWMPSLWIA